MMHKCIHTFFFFYHSNTFTKKEFECRSILKVHYVVLGKKFNEKGKIFTV